MSLPVNPSRLFLRLHVNFFGKVNVEKRCINKASNSDANGKSGGNLEKALRVKRIGEVNP